MAIVGLVSIFGVEQGFQLAMSLSLVLLLAASLIYADRRMHSTNLRRDRPNVALPLFAPLA